MDQEKPVSFRQFAKMVGLGSDNSVRKAIERGSIVDGVTSDKKIIPSVAAEEWGKEILPEFLSPDQIKKSVGVQKMKEKSVPPKPKRVKIEKPEPETAAEIVKDIMSEKLPHVKKSEVDAEPDDVEFDDEEETEISDQIKKPEAERRTAILKAKILKLAYEEKKGALISREKIATVLFAYGHEIRSALEGLSNRAIDDIRACETREEAKRVLDKEIHTLLNDVSEIVNREL